MKTRFFSKWNKIHQTYLLYCNRWHTAYIDVHQINVSHYKNTKFTWFKHNVVNITIPCQTWLTTQQRSNKGSTLHPRKDTWYVNRNGVLYFSGIHIFYQWALYWALVTFSWPQTFCLVSSKHMKQVRWNWTSLKVLPCKIQWHLMTFEPYPWTTHMKQRSTILWQIVVVLGPHL